MSANPIQPFDEADAVSVEDGIVLVDGPGGVAIALTPEAARGLGQRLIAAADKAEG
jgi:hypothetical protein